MRYILLILVSVVSAVLLFSGIEQSAQAEKQQGVNERSEEQKGMMERFKDWITGDDKKNEGTKDSPYVKGQSKDKEEKNGQEGNSSKEQNNMPWQERSKSDERKQDSMKKEEEKQKDETDEPFNIME